MDDGDDGELFFLAFFQQFGVFVCVVVAPAVVHLFQTSSIDGRNDIPRSRDPLTIAGPPLPFSQLILLARGYKSLEEDSRCKAVEAARLLVEAETQAKLLQEKVQGTSFLYRLSLLCRTPFAKWWCLCVRARARAWSSLQRVLSIDPCRDGG